MASERRSRKSAPTASALERTYKDRGGNYSSTHSLGMNDIPKAIFALHNAYEYLAEGQRRREGNGEEGASPNGNRIGD